MYSGEFSQFHQQPNNIQYGGQSMLQPNVSSQFSLNFANFPVEAKQQISALLSEVKSQMQQLSIYETKILKLEQCPSSDQLSILKNENAQLQERLNQTTNQFLQMKTEMATKTIIINKLTAAVQQWETQCVEAENAQQIGRVMVPQLQTKLTQANITINQQEATILDYEKEIQEIKHQLINLNDKVKKQSQLLTEERYYNQQLCQENSELKQLILEMEELQKKKAQKQVDEAKQKKKERQNYEANLQNQREAQRAEQQQKRERNADKIRKANSQLIDERQAATLEKQHSLSKQKSKPKSAKISRINSRTPEGAIKTRELSKIQFFDIPTQSVVHTMSNVKQEYSGNAQIEPLQDSFSGDLSVTVSQMLTDLK